MIVFCGTRLNVEKAAVDLAKLCAAGVLLVPERSTSLSSGDASGKRAAFLSELPRSLPNKLRECLEHGIGYHHGSASLFYLLQR